MLQHAHCWGGGYTATPLNCTPVVQCIVNAPGDERRQRLRAAVGLIHAHVRSGRRQLECEIREEDSGLLTAGRCGLRAAGRCGLRAVGDG